MIEVDGIVYAQNPMKEVAEVCGVIPLDGYKLLLTFKGGEKRLFDLSGKLDLPAFSPLKDKNFFNTAHISGHTVAWSDDVDYCPDCLYQESVPYMW